MGNAIGRVDKDEPLVELKNMSFGYQKDSYTLKNVSMKIMAGKTYAFVGPTGGGKSTTAAIIARLYRAAEGEVLYNGRDIHSYTQSELANSIGFILQDPILFSGSIRDNIVYGNEQYRDYTAKQLEKVLIEKELSKVLDKFPGGLNTPVDNSSENISLGQKQLVAFIRVMLRSPELIILDEATANIDTVTEQLLEDILDGRTMTGANGKNAVTKIVIAHRLNTVKSADEIYFIAAGEVTGPVKFKEALELISSNKESHS
jgi:ATP-binding cassette subfamily B protein